MYIREFVVELFIADRRQKREIRQLEQELPKWQVLVDSVTGAQFHLPVDMIPVYSGVTWVIMVKILLWCI